MKMAFVSGWDADIERGPDWLFVRLHEPEFVAANECGFAERMWELLQQSFSHRLVIELDQLSTLSSHLVGQLVLLHKRISSRGGIMRICGLSPDCERVLQIHRLHDRLYPYRSREDAVLGGGPKRPR
jgi:anti-anti-sigma factor